MRQKLHLLVCSYLDSLIILYFQFQKSFVLNIKSRKITIPVSCFSIVVERIFWSSENQEPNILILRLVSAPEQRYELDTIDKKVFSF